MKNFFNKTGIWILAAAVVIVLTLSILSATGTGLLNNIAGTIASPFRSAGAAIGNWFGSISDKFDSVEALQKENEELRKRVAQLEDANRQAETDSQENERLRSLLNLRQQRRDFTFESAKVTQYENSNWASTLTLNRGTSSGVAVNNCVVNETGALVGVVTEVGLNWCTVATVLDTRAQFGATVRIRRGHGRSGADAKRKAQAQLPLRSQHPRRRRPGADLRLGRILSLGSGHRNRGGCAHRRLGPDPVRRSTAHSDALLPGGGVRHHRLRHRGLRGAPWDVVTLCLNGSFTP